MDQIPYYKDNKFGGKTKGKIGFLIIFAHLIFPLKKDLLQHLILIIYPSTFFYTTNGENMKFIQRSLICFCFVFIAQAQELKTLTLPEPQTGTGMPVMEALRLRQTSRNFDTKPLPFQELSNILWAANGINRPETGKRTAPSAQNWQEVEIYVFLQEGTYRYNATDHNLIPVVAKDLRAKTGTQAFVANAPVSLVYISDQSKMLNVSNEQKLILGGADVAFCAQNVYLYGASAGLAVGVRASIDVETLSTELQLPATSKIILAQSIGYPKP